MTSVLIGLIYILLGAGGFAFSKSVLAAIPFFTGLVVTLVAYKNTIAPAMWRSVLLLLVSCVLAIAGASAVPRLVRLLLGGEIERPGDIFVAGTTALVGLVHATVLIRQLFAKPSVEAP